MEQAIIALATTMVYAVSLAYIETNIREMETRFEGDLTTQYYTDPFDNVEDPFPAQKLAALRCFAFLYQLNTVWVHLAAPMQSGKTGVMVTLTRLIMNHVSTLGVTPTRMFVFTGMSDNDWRSQTKSRFPVHIRTNIYHKSGVKDLCAALVRLRGADNLRNILLFIDESHIATKKDHTPRRIYETLTTLCPREQWAANNIRIVTVSATDPAKVITIRTEDGLPSRVVRLDTTEEYQSIEKLVRDRRIRPINGNAHTETAINLMRPVLEGYDSPRYHIIRAAHGKAVETQDALARAFPLAGFVSYDSNSRSNTAGEAESADLLDINTLLEQQPTVHTFIIIKNAFYAAKTLEDRFVGILYDRQTDNDSAVLQGLAGRACGYGKSTDTVVFTVESAIERYLKTWRSLCLSIGNVNLNVEEEGYTTPARVMNLDVENTDIRVNTQELNPMLATVEAMNAVPVVPQPRPAALEHRTQEFVVGNDSIRATVSRVMEWIQANEELDPRVKRVKFDGRTASAIEKHRDEEGRYMASFGGDWRVRTYAQMEASRQNLSFDNNHPARLQPCYNNGTLVLALRYLTGRTL